MTQMCTYFKTKTDVAQNLINKFFSNFYRNFIDKFLLYHTSLILQTLHYTLKRLGDTEKVVSWKSQGLSTEKLTTPTTTDASLSPSIKWYRNTNFCLMFTGNCLK